MNRLKKVLLGLAALAALAMGGSALAGATSGGNDTAAQERSEAAEAPEQGTENEAAENEAADKDDVQDEEGDQALGSRLEARLKAAALAETGGGTVGEIERDGEKGATYEVEVTKADGSQVDVRLDDQLKVVAVDADGNDEQTGEHEGG
jgi:uncharacterized membrane protein YkoI